MKSTALFFVLALVSFTEAKAQDFLRSAETSFFDDAQKQGQHRAFDVRHAVSSRADGLIDVEVRISPANKNAAELAALIEQVSVDHKNQIRARLRSESLPDAADLVQLDRERNQVVLRRAVRSASDAPSVAKEALGLAHAVTTYGRFDHDALVGAWSGIEASEIAKLREALFAAREIKKPLMVSLILNDYEREARDQSTTPRKSVRNGDSWSVFMPPTSIGLHAIQLPKDSIVWHRLAHHPTVIRGGYNPSTMNSQIAMMLENKWVEYLFWEKYAPGAMPRGVLLSNVFGSRPDPKEVNAKLGDIFKTGWVMKGAFDWASGPTILTDSTNVAAAIDEFKKGDFKTHLDSMMARKHQMDLDDFIEGLQKHKDYKGFRAQKLLKQHERTIVQERLRITQEYRVEVITGKVLGGDSTVARYAYMEEDPKTFWDAQRPQKPEPAEELERKRQVEAFAQEIMDRLPQELRFSGALDVALTESGRPYLIEANPGGNSGYFAFRAPSRRALEKRLLEDYSKSPRPADLGLPRAEQVRWQREFFEKNGIDVASQYPDFELRPDGLHWTELKPVPGPVAGALRTCRDLFR